MATVAWLILVPISAVLVWYDIRFYRLPNIYVGSAFLVGLVCFFFSGPLVMLLRALFSSLVLCAGYLLLRLISKNSLGMGDVKLAAVVGLYLGYQSVEAVVMATWLAFLSGGLFAFAGMLAGKANRRSRIAFGPFMLLGLWLAFIYQDAAIAIEVV